MNKTSRVNGTTFIIAMILYLFGLPILPCLFLYNLIQPTTPWETIGTIALLVFMYILFLVILFILLLILGERF